MRLWIPGRPVTASRPRFDSRTRRAYTSREYESWKERAVLRLRPQIEGRVEGPVEVRIDVRPDGLVVVVDSLAERVRPKGLRGDLDNYVKAALDSVTQAGALEDDRQVESLDARFWPTTEEREEE